MPGSKLAWSGAAAPELPTRGELALMAAQVFQDVLAELARLPAVDHGPGQRAGEQRAEGEGAAPGPAGQPPAQLPGQRRPGDHQEPAGHGVDAAPVRPRADVGAPAIDGAALGGD